jgi:hypothetical protein
MIHSGEITDIQAMIVLMLGSMSMLPIFALRSQLPGKIAIFGTQLGLQIIVYRCKNCQNEISFRE